MLRNNGIFLTARGEEGSGGRLEGAGVFVQSDERFRGGWRGYLCGLLVVDDFTYFSLSSQSSFHLSLTVLVRYRSPANI